jgi:hypothetical protein
MMPERATLGQQNPTFRAFQAGYMLHINNILAFKGRGRSESGINTHIINILKDALNPRSRTQFGSDIY